ncbi:hypothetical protein IC229_22620 [Spirosoma sp. BT702]|uniref:Lipoprotein n=1 Tax=Spirosoma profusum TaxID=2771354 RepID=A0A926Y042_9BACT|nr:hypothetical protein [Spirosoma profusum]MBD2703456.1 hypothetical protein [Spirosoma profusum]
MKQVSQFIFIIWITLLFVSQSCTPIDNGPNTKVDINGGYKNLKLDAPFDSINKLVDLKPTFDNPCTGTKKFEITAEPYTAISTINFNKVELEFVRDSLCRVILFSPYTYQISRQLHELFRGEFGEPSEERKTQSGSKYTTYKWTGVNGYVHIRQQDHSDFEVEYGSFRGKSRSLEEEKKCDQRKL